MASTQPIPLVPTGAPQEIIGLKLGDYVVEAEVAQGGMGIVYRAVHPLIGRQVAVKVLKPETAYDPEQAARFLLEAKALSAIKHRGIIDIISFGQVPDGRQYMVMEFLHGEPLEAMLHREGPLTPARALGLVDEMLDALTAAHGVGVVHRDLKPSNVFMAEQSNGTRYVKLVDFGLARQASLSDLFSRSGDKASVMAGTPEYLSPEQAMGLTATPKSDLYSLGVLLFEMVTGTLPFQNKSVAELVEAHVKQKAPRAMTRVANLPPDVDDLIASLVEKDPNERPESAEAVRHTVQRIVRQLRDESTFIATRATPSRLVVGARVTPGLDLGRAPSAPTVPSTSELARSLRSGRGARRWGLVAMALTATLGLGWWLASRGAPPPVVEVPMPQPVPPTPVVVPALQVDAGATVVLGEPLEPKEEPTRGPKKPKAIARGEGKPKTVPAACESKEQGAMRNNLWNLAGVIEQKARRAKVTVDSLETVAKRIDQVRDQEDCVEVARRLAAWDAIHVKGR